MPNNFVCKFSTSGGPSPLGELARILNQANRSPEREAWFGTHKPGREWRDVGICIVLASPALDGIIAEVIGRTDQMPDDPLASEQYRDREGHEGFAAWWHVRKPTPLHFETLDKIPGRSYSSGQGAAAVFHSQVSFAYWDFGGASLEDLVKKVTSGSGQTVSHLPPLTDVASTLPPPTAPTGLARTITLHPTRRYARAAGSILCLGLDVAWWGGSSARPGSQNDTISYVLIGEKPDILQMRRVPLSATYNATADDFTPNCDPSATLTFAAVEQIINTHSASQIVMAVDAPLIAKSRGLPPRSKIGSPGSTRREPEQVLAEAISAGPVAWRSACNIQPGAPVFTRVAALVHSLTTRLGFQLYDHCSPGTQNRLLIECFPSESIWALGSQNYYEAITPEQAREYKQLKDRFYPLPTLMNALYTTLAGFIPAIGVPGPWVREWVAQISSTILTDPELGDGTGRLLKGGKLFDDMIDSVNALFTAVSFCYDAAHVWFGPHADDGHIVGAAR
jgi:hypothetical protein